MTRPALLPVPRCGLSAKPDCGAARAERLTIYALVFFRAGGLAELISVLALDWRHYRSPAPVLILVGALAIESLVLIGACRRRGQIKGSWVAGDVAFLIAALVIGALLTAPADGHTWLYFMYPFSVISSCLIGVAYPRLPAVLAVTMALAGGYALSAIVIHHDAPWNVTPNAVTYFTNAVVAWAVVRELRRNARSLDAAQANSVIQAAELARERERAQHARILHDHVLQTLEALIRQGSIADRKVHFYVAAEAAWLRALVEGTPSGEPGDILSRLQYLIQQQAAAGVQVEFNNAQLLRTPSIRRRLDPEVSDALVDAAREALTNVAKHAGVGTAIMRVTATDGQLNLSILDHGVGFDPGRVRCGIGLQESISDRVREIGGSVRIDSSPDAGTYIEMAVPVRAPHDRDGTEACHQPARRNHH